MAPLVLQSELEATSEYVVKISDLVSLDDYAGNSVSSDINLALGLLGGSYGEFQSTNGKTHGQIFGYAPGSPWAANVSVNYAYYIGPFRLP